MFGTDLVHDISRDGNIPLVIEVACFLHGEDLLQLIFHIIVLIGTQFVGEGETWLYWRFNELLEALFLVLIIWSAWKWPTIEPQHQ